MGPERAALRALAAIARLHGVAADADALAHELGLPPSADIPPEDLLLAARQLKLRARLVRSTPDRLAFVPLPALARVQPVEGGAHRWMVLAQCDGHQAILQDPCDAEARPQSLAVDAFTARWSGELMLIASDVREAGGQGRFDLSWFAPAIVKHRRVLGEVLVISLFLQLFALVSPLFFQVIMDKVLVHRGTSTLDVLMVGLIGVVVFETVLSALRTYAFSHTTSRIDVELGARLFRHLLQLPLGYFQARRTGDSVARVRELENIRRFITGSALTAVLDVLFAVVFVGVMLFYSVPLTLIVLASLPVYVVISLAVVPLLRLRLEQRFTRGAESQAMLVETVTAIQTVKASALEPAFARRWESILAGHVSAGFRAQTLASWAQEAVGLVGKLTNAALLWYGATLVMDGRLTVGQFIAFTLFAQRVAQPILRLAQLWTDFQQTGISMARLGDILNTPPEVPAGAGTSLPPIKGRITLEQVTFRYRPEGPAVLQNITFDLPPGSVIGIVGRSGSGKSTLTRLVQRLHRPESGRILVDGVDIGLIDSAQLRRQVGVVLQENQLFNRSVRENIAISDPAAPMDLVTRAARMAGAHDFIAELPEGYDTPVGEQGSLLSGGQRQRIAIARALFANPRILILDEATSALDYESEAIIRRNMAQICQGRTVLVIAHRLSAVRHAHQIIVLDKGRIVEAGRHDELVRRDKGLYAHLWRLQQGDEPAPAQVDRTTEWA